MENSGSRQQRSRKKRKHKKSRNRSANIKSRSEASSSDLPNFHNPLAVSQCDWFWHNYRQTKDWQTQHHIAYWRSRALASEYQNSLLVDFVENLELPTQCKENPSVPKYEGDEIDDKSLVFEINDEMMSFFAQSIKHKKELKKQREDDIKLVEQNDTAIDNQALWNDMTEKTLFYGKDLPTIVAMETCMQLGFERFVDKKKPPYWPNIPLKL